jgi:hypothetical protein
MGTCLFAKALPNNGHVYLLIKNLLPSSECCFVVCFEVGTQQWRYMLQYVSVTTEMFHDIGCLGDQKRYEMEAQLIRSDLTKIFEGMNSRVCF